MTNLLAAEGTQSVTAASGVFTLGWLLIALPLAGALVLLVGGRRTDRIGHLVGTAMPAASFVLGVVLFIAMLGRDAEDRALGQHLFAWVPAGSLQVDAGLLIDQLSMCFVLLITGVGTLIHVYSIAYMEHDLDRRRFFGYLNLFIAAMLLLVLADSYLLLYVGWEGVGLASYLLIGFWSYVPAYAAAAKKAFVVNRVGDFGLSVAIMIMFWQFGSVSFADVFSSAEGASEAALTVMGLMLLLGACGKSAQFPLQSWLGDAMAGPTPVSALIHAATMVTAGVYLVVRSAPIFAGAPDAQLAVAIVGAITLLFGAVIGTAKDDIKKALAASTMSQIGYMMLAAGLGPIGYAFAIFHLLTHGFFKAGMFLGAGSVMHGMNDQVDMRRFGGVVDRHEGHLGHVRAGLAGDHRLPGRAPGFWSKDAIIESAFVGDGWQPWVLGDGRACRRRHHRVLHDPVVRHDLPRRAALGATTCTRTSRSKIMTIPLIVLAVGSALLGLVLGPTGGSSTGWPRSSASTARRHPSCRSGRHHDADLAPRGRGRRAGLARCTCAARCPSRRRPGRSPPGPRGRTCTRTP